MKVYIDAGDNIQILSDGSDKMIVEKNTKEIPYIRFKIQTNNNLTLVGYITVDNWNNAIEISTNKHELHHVLKEYLIKNNININQWNWNPS